MEKYYKNFSERQGINKDEILKNFYLTDFIKNLTQSNNVPVLLYLVLNIFLIGLIVSTLFGMPFWQGLFDGIILYIISITIALSPVGEWILRLQTGCRRTLDAIISRGL